MPKPFARNLWGRLPDEVGVGRGDVLTALGSSSIQAAILDVVFPVGSYKWQAHSTPDTGFLAADGQEVNRTTYARLFAKIGTTYGVGNGTTTFNLPNVKGRMLVHLDTGDAYWNAMGESRGSNTATLAVTNMPTHDHLYGAVGTQYTLENSGDPHTHTAGGNQFVRTAASGTTTLAVSAGQQVEFVTDTSNESDPHLHEMPGHDHGVVAQGSGTAFDITQKSIVGYCTIRY